MKKKINTMKKRKPLPKFIQVLLWIFNILSLVVIIATGFMNILPLKYFIPFAILIIILDLLTCRFLIRKKKKKRIIGLIMFLILTILYSIGLFYEFKTHSFLGGITSGGETITETYAVVVKSSSNYQDIKDLRNEKIGLLNCDEDGYKKATNKLDSTIKFDASTYDDSYSLVDSLLKDEVNAFLLEDSQEKILEENYDNYLGQTRILYTFTIELKEEDTKKDTDITKNSFSIYISGIDTYGNIKSTSRSDVNIVATVNPNTGKISLVSIPRDYYVQLYKKNGLKDKLTHAGIYGVDTSVKTIEKLLDIDINYYVKFNFTSVIKIVDKLGGVRVYSDETFRSGMYDPNTTEEYTYYKGWNNLNGKQALSFARERHSFNDGDRVRGKHQEALIEAILNKVISPKIIVSYSSLLDALQDTFITNLDETNMTNFIKMQIDKNIDWNVESMVMNGTNGSEFTYSYPRQKLYVMIPTEDSINEAKNQINKVFNGE